MIRSKNFNGLTKLGKFTDLVLKTAKTIINNGYVVFINQTFKLHLWSVHTNFLVPLSS